MAHAPADAEDNYAGAPDAMKYEEEESDEYDVEDDDEDAVGEDDDGEEEEDDGSEEPGLTHLLLGDGANADVHEEEEEEEEEDSGFVPDGGSEPADEEVDGDEHEVPAPQPIANGGVSVGAKRARNPDEGVEADVAEAGGKRVKA